MFLGKVCFHFVYVLNDHSSLKLALGPKNVYYFHVVNMGMALRDVK